MNGNQELELIKKTLDSTAIGVTITDPSLKDNPIIYVNQGFLALTQYSKEEVIGRNCRFLQGAETDPGTVKKIKASLLEKKVVSIEIKNCKKDGSYFWNELFIEPIFIESEEKHYFIGFQKDITKQKKYQLDLERSLEKIEELSTPIVPISKNISILPLIGQLTTERSESILQKTTEYISKTNNKFVIVDLSGLYRVEQDEVVSLLKLFQVLSLMGTELILTGVSSELLLSTSSELVSGFSNIRTFMTVKDALTVIQ